MYQSRMKILKSRDGNSGRRSTFGDKIMREKSFSASFVDRGTRRPCPEEKLLPPIQMMTKQRSFRHLYLKYHPPKVNTRMDFLVRKEDPKLKKKRDDIFARIKAAEIASERIKRDKERVAGQRRNAINDGLSISNSLSEHSGNDESQDDLLDNNEPKEGGASLSHDMQNVIVSGFVAEPTNKLMDSTETSVVSLKSVADDNYEEETTFGDNFAFLSYWKNEVPQMKMASLIK